MGIVSILTTLSLTFSGFYVFISSLVSQKENFKYINWIYSYSEYQVGLQNANGLYKTPAINFEEFKSLIENEKKSRIGFTQQYMLLQQNNTNPDIEVFNIIKDMKIQQKQYSNKNKYYNYDVSLMYSMLMQMGSIFFFINEYDKSGIMKYQSETNYPSLNEQVQSVIEKLNSTYQSQLDNILSQALVQLFVVLGVTFIFLCSIIPSYKFTKLKQQKILELLATFDPASLKEILGQLTYQIGNYSVLDKNQTIVSRSNLTMNQTHVSRTAQAHVNIEKKLNISRTSTLNYSVKYLAVALVIIFALIMIYPIVNYLTVRQFIENSKVIYNFNNCVCETQFSIVNILRARQGVSIGYLMPEVANLPLSDYQTLFDKLLPVVNGLTEQMQENISNVKATDLYNKEVFNDFLLGVYENNSCDIIGNYTQYQNGNFNKTNCLSVGRNNLQKGLLNGLQFFYSLFKESYGFKDRIDKAAFLVDYNIFNKNVAGINQFKFKIELSKIHDYLLNFFQDQNAILYDHYYNITIILVSYQLCFVIAVFLVSWGYYFKNINSLIYTTKELLDIFPQQTLIQNTYIMSFLRKND